MATSSFICMLATLILLIIAIARIQGSPKLATNLLVSLAFGVVVGLGIHSKIDNRTSSKKESIEQITSINQFPIQAMQIIGVTPTITATTELVGKDNNWFTNNLQDNLQQSDQLSCIYANTRDIPYENSS